MTDQLARQIYWGLLEAGIAIDFNCSFDELPHDFREQLQAVAGMLPLPDPYAKLNEFAARAKRIGHYHVATHVQNFHDFENQGDGT